MLGNLGSAYAGVGDFSKALDYQQQHLAIAREVGDRQAECNALGNLGRAYQSWVIRSRRSQCSSRV